MIFIQFGPRVDPVPEKENLVKALSIVAGALVALSLTVPSCKDAGNLFGSTPVPGKLGSAHAFGNGGGSTSLVSLIFLSAEEIEDLSVVDRITGNPTPFHAVVWDGRTVVTLELPKNQLANPRLAFSGGTSFTALLTPEQSLSTFDGLNFGDHTVFLRDHGVEIELKVGMEKVISEDELTIQWIGDRLAKVARVNFRPEVSGNYSPILKPVGTVVVFDKSQLLNLESTLVLGAHQSVSLVVVPPTDTGETIRFSILGR